MSLFSRFFGRKDTDDLAGAQLLANPDIKAPLSLQVLFPETCRLDAGQLIEAFKSYHRSMSDVRCEIDSELNREGNLFGMIGWGKHVIRLVGFDRPYPAEALEARVAPSHYTQELKRRARSHKAHVILYYAGRESSPFEQYVALAAAAGVMAWLGAIVVLNESGHTSFPAAALSDSDSDGDALDLLRAFPLAILFCGFVKYEVEGTPEYGCAPMERRCLDCPTSPLTRQDMQKDNGTSTCSKTSSDICASLAPDWPWDIRCRSRMNTSAFAQLRRRNGFSKAQRCLSPR
jgi:hypothetical protein